MHAYQTETEPWKYGQTVEDNMRKMMNLRYRLLPYIYSEAWNVTENGSTMMRPMVMDFNNDAEAVSQSYEFMFGKAILVAPITEAGAMQRKVYLPDSEDWFNFWTGENIKGGQTIIAEAPLDKIPLYIKAGSILPMGPIIQHSNEKPNEAIEIRVYEGSDGEFSLYEDENDNYNYEKGFYSSITFIWNDTKRTLTINDREGSFPGMIAERNFNIVLISKNKIVGSETERIDKAISYRGREITTGF
jgi:alpha-D-xyloside xylohydrolase